MHSTLEMTEATIDEWTEQSPPIQTNRENGKKQRPSNTHKKYNSSFIREQGENETIL